MKYRPKKLKSDIIWLANILSAFKCRFDPMGQEDHRCGERFEEMHEVGSHLASAIKEIYNYNERTILYLKLEDLNEAVIELIELPRNATDGEIYAAQLALVELTTLMADMLTSRVNTNTTRARN